MVLAALTYEDNLHRKGKGWAGIRRFVNIAGVSGDWPSCLVVGFSNPFLPPAVLKCFQQICFWFLSGFAFAMGFNHWTGEGGPMSLRRAPIYHPEVNFYTLHAGYHDQIHCTTARRYRSCSEGRCLKKLKMCVPS